MPLKWSRAKRWKKQDPFRRSTRARMRAASEVPVDQATNHPAAKHSGPSFEFPLFRRGLTKDDYIDMLVGEEDWRRRNED